MTNQIPSSRSTVIGVDVGGTFTDLFVLDEATGAVRIVKVPSTRAREAKAGSYLWKHSMHPG